MWHLDLPSCCGGTLLALFNGGANDGNGELSRDEEDRDVSRPEC